MSNQKERTCPICKRKYFDYPALSRKDNKTLICPECGMHEALDEYRKSIIDAHRTKIKEDDEV